MAARRFAAGKPTSLLLDVGATHTSAIPVVDGFVLRKGIRRAQGLGGDAVSRALLYDLSTSSPLNSPRTGGRVSIVPHYLVKSKAPVGAGAPAAAVLRNERAAQTTDSYAAFARMRVLHEAKESLAQVLDMPWDHAQAAARPARPFEFPDGYNDAFGVERFRAPEVMFSPEQLWADKPGVVSCACSWRRRRETDAYLLPPRTAPGWNRHGAAVDCAARAGRDQLGRRGQSPGALQQHCLRGRR